MIWTSARQIEANIVRGAMGVIARKGGTISHQN